MGARLGARPRLVAVGEVGERPRRRQVIERERERLLELRLGALEIGERVLQEQAGLGVQLRLLQLVGGVARLGAQPVQALLMVALLRRDAPERLDRRQVPGLDVERGLVRSDRVARIEQHLLVDGADAVVDLDRLLGGAEQLRLGLQLLEGVEPIAALFVERPERVDGLLRARVEVEGTATSTDQMIAAIQGAGRFQAKIMG